MALDGIFLSKIKDELLREIAFSRVEKVHQPSREELVIHLRGKSGAKKLFLSIRGNSPRIHLTEYAPENPAVPLSLSISVNRVLTEFFTLTLTPRTKSAIK